MVEISSYLWLRRLAWFFARLLSWLLSCTGSQHLIFVFSFVHPSHCDALLHADAYVQVHSQVIITFITFIVYPHYPKSHLCWASSWRPLQPPRGLHHPQSSSSSCSSQSLYSSSNTFLMLILILIRSEFIVSRNY